MIIAGTLGSISSEEKVLSGKCREPLKENGVFMQILGTLMGCGQDNVLQGEAAIPAEVGRESEETFQGTFPMENMMLQLKLPGWLMGKPGSALLQSLSVVPMLFCKLPPGVIIRQKAWDNNHKALAFQTTSDGFKDSGIKQQLEILPELPAGLPYNRKDLEGVAGKRSGVWQALEAGILEGSPVDLEEVSGEKALSDSEKFYARFTSKEQRFVEMPGLKPGGVPPVKVPEEKPLVAYQPVKVTKPETARDLASAVLPPGAAGEVSAQTNVVDDVPLDEVTRVVAMQVQRLTEGRQQKVNLQLKLRPSHLGDLTVRLSLEKGGELKAHFYTDNSMVRDIIEAALNQLKDVLAAQRLLLREAAVFLGDGSGNYGQYHQLDRRFEAGTWLTGSGSQVVENMEAPEENNSLINYLI